MIPENSLRKQIFAYAANQYGTSPEYLWAIAPDYAVLRHRSCRKWYGLLMDVAYEKLDEKKTGPVDVLNVKLDDPLLCDFLIGQDGYYRGYHISRGNWVSVVLDGTVALDEICRLLDRSFQVTAAKPKRRQEP